MKKKFKFERDSDDCHFLAPEKEWLPIEEYSEISFLCVHYKNKTGVCEDIYCPKIIKSDKKNLTNRRK